MIGYSLSFCIKDICEGRVNESQVEKLNTSTSCPTIEVFEDVLVDYQKIYWAKYPEKAYKIAMTFWNSGKIYQPLLEGKDCYNISGGHWSE